MEFEKKQEAAKAILLYNPLEKLGKTQYGMTWTWNKARLKNCLPNRTDITDIETNSSNEKDKRGKEKESCRRVKRAG